MLAALSQRKNGVAALPIYDRRGQTVGWLEEDTIRLLDGTIAAFLTGEAVFNISGVCVGFIHDHCFRDLHGDAVAFLAGAAGGLPFPLPERAPMPRPFSYAPTRPIGSRPPVRPKAPVWSVDWSFVTWETFLMGDY